MITTAYVQGMARYNTWQNKQISVFIDAMDEAELRQDRGAFFGSILATLNHILLADALWLERLGADMGDMAARVKEIDPAEATSAEWRIMRAQVDVLLEAWAHTVNDELLSSTLDWTSGVMARDFTHPLYLCVVHFFNHQTHHRGQVHAMLTAAGSKAPVSDIIFMSEHA